MITVSGSKSSGVLPIIDSDGNTMSVAAEMMARKNRIAVKGLTNASESLRASDFFLPRVTTLRPLSASLCATSSRVSPPRFEPTQDMASVSGMVAACTMRPSARCLISSFCAWTADGAWRIFSFFTCLAPFSRSDAGLPSRGASHQDGPASADIALLYWYCHCRSRSSPLFRVCDRL